MYGHSGHMMPCRIALAFLVGDFSQHVAVDVIRFQQNNNKCGAPTRTHSPVIGAAKL